MLTSLDLLILVFIGLVAMTLVTVPLMFIIKNKIVRKIFLGIVCTLGVYMAGVGIYIGFGMFMIQTAIGVLALLSCIAAFIFGMVFSRNKWAFLATRIAAGASLVIALFNAVL